MVFSFSMQIHHSRPDPKVCKLEKYGDVFPERVFTQALKSHAKTNNREYELKQRTGNLSHKEEVIRIIERSIQRSNTEQELVTILRQAGFEFYRRGKSQTPGIIDQGSGKRYRLKTLRLDRALEKFERMEELEKLRKIELTVERDLN